ncbi:MAG: O-methyltransferase [Proteobacteria bacterium]|nr:O-methyltransferase [Pseudomonadota bacterium]MBU4469837.1 O-methyltransferase [Pseudomonadota bacterium]MCG2753072.1 O-methyltransferase [Desulfobacteraceae bacterium]
MSVMIQNPEDFFSGLIPGRSNLLKSLEAEALEEGIPIIGPVVGELLHILVKVAGAKRVLELGTATGYSAIHMARAMDPKTDQLITLELSQGLVQRARENFKKAGVQDIVTLLQGDCREIMKEISGSFDLIFMDIDKQYYLEALPLCHRLLSPNGLLITDNTAFADSLDFNQAVYQDKGWRSVNLLCFLPLHSPEKDGICVAMKN